MLDQRFESEAITISTEAGNHPDRDPRNKGVLTELFAGVDVGKVNLDHREFAPDQRVSQADARMRQPRRVDQDPVGVASGFLNPVDQQSLVIGLKGIEFTSGLLGEAGEQAVYFGEIRRPVDLRFSGAEHVQIWAVDYENAQ